MKYFIMRDDGLDQNINDKDTYKPITTVLRVDDELSNERANNLLRVARLQGRINPRIESVNEFFDLDESTEF